ncbi:hypothetical protein AB6H27_02860 [Providencia huaxiensis]|uniref:hypothetical protein n=1 Tax=Providencia huaxiensis TaxID=2027290 RepID=UPI0034DCDD11
MYLVVVTKAEVSEKTREKILCVAKELGYQPNINAQILRSGNSRTVAFIVPDIQQPYFGKVVHAAELSATKSGYSLILLDSYANKQWVNIYFHYFKVN